ncbi:adipokinetic hormone/corazonin-related peptide receptor variant I-like isoform X2 [Ornithodoros turicata]|uniref:adipokinetic hormone/corazonin-related peptide receptor variant I-like isoform X2 n=1 Tax=Ornithodoros turicata TaxID=34597 RepID=UPI0031391006
MCYQLFTVTFYLPHYLPLNTMTIWTIDMPMQGLRNMLDPEGSNFSVTPQVFLNATYDDNENLPEDLRFNTHAMVQVIIYIVLFVVATSGNVPVFISLLGKRHRKSRIKLMIMHLALADLIVTFFMIPLEVIWRLTVQWLAGNAMCKTMQVLRAFGPYLSSMVLVCISLDRYYAILHPLKVNYAQRRGKIMLLTAWITSFVCSLPQAVIFHVMEHPAFPGFTQCVTFDSFPTPVHERLYNLFCLLVLYGLPLSIIIVCYTRIFWEIHRQSRDPHNEYCQQHQSVRGRMCLRRSDTRQIQRARNRTLRLTIIIVLAFFWCWTPYVTMVLWYQFDPDGAEHVNSYLQSSLFMFAVSNSCVNPLVYGSYTSKFRNCWARCLEGTPCPVSEHVLRQNANSIRRAPCTSLPDASKLQQNCSLCSDASVYPCEVTIRFKGHVCKNGSTSTRTMAPSCCCKKGSVDFMNGSHRRMTVPARCYAPEKRDVEDS